MHGFLPIDVGARLQAVWESFAVPTEADECRTAARRRVDTLDDVLTGLLADRLPTDGTVVPQIHVTVDAGTLQQALAPCDDPAFAPQEPATLVGLAP